MVSTRMPTEEIPAFTPLPYGLLSSVEVVTDPDIHWGNGVEFQPDPCGPAGSVQAACVTGTGELKSDTHDLDTSGANPFAVMAWIKCAPVGHGDELERLRVKTERALTNNEGMTVESVFWTGTVAATGSVYPHLASDDVVTDGTFGLGQVVELQSAATLPVTGIVDVVEGIGLLEESMGTCYGGVPTLHVPRAAVAHLANHGQVVDRDGKLYTKGGSLVVAGGGYPRIGPTGAAAAAGNAWFYATGAVKVWRSGVEFHDPRPANVVNRADNTVYMIAERRYVIDWDCCHFAVQVSLGGETAGTAGAST